MGYERWKLEAKSFEDYGNVLQPATDSPGRLLQKKQYRRAAEAEND